MIEKKKGVGGMEWEAKSTEIQIFTRNGSMLFPLFPQQKHFLSEGNLFPEVEKFFPSSDEFCHAQAF